MKVGVATMIDIREGEDSVRHPDNVVNQICGGSWLMNMFFEEDYVGGVVWDWCGAYDESQRDHCDCVKKDCLGIQPYEVTFTNCTYSA